MILIKKVISGSTLFICISSALAAPEFTKTLSKNGLDEIGIVQALPAGELSSNNIAPYAKSIKKKKKKKEDDYVNQKEKQRSIVKSYDGWI